MNLVTAKVDLVKRILETEDKELIHYLQAIFDSQPENWFVELPDAIQASVDRGLKQSQRGEGRTHSEVMKKYRK